MSCVREFCAEQGKRTFMLTEFMSLYGERLRELHPKNNHPQAKIRQKLQALRDDGVLSFVNNRGAYTYRERLILPGELEDDKIGEVLKSRPERREYVMETFARNRGWVREAKEVFGCTCMAIGCGLTFTTAGNKPYIEVHHIVPLCEGGEDGIWNLSVLCAHHHKMAHFALPKVREDFAKYLTDENKKRLQNQSAQ